MAPTDKIPLFKTTYLYELYTFSILFNHKFLHMKPVYFMLLIFLFSTALSYSQGSTSYTEQEIIYGRKNGLASTMIMVKPEKANGKGIISIISGNWVSDYKRYPQFLNGESQLLNAGYTIFFTLHSSAPLFDISVAAADIKRAVQFIRYNASAYGIDPDNLGITGSSSGGHLALLAGTSDDIRDANAKDPIEKTSSKVQAVAIFFPPTDFLNWGQQGFNPTTQKSILEQFGILGAFNFKQFDSAKSMYTSIRDEGKIQEIVKSISPANLVTPDDAPTYIIHGDADRVVPLQQSTLIREIFVSKKVPFSLTIKQGEDHGWKNMAEDRKEFVKWFDKYLNAQ